MEYHQNASDSCYFSSLAYVFTASGEKNSARDIVMWIDESLHYHYKDYKYRIVFATSIMKDQVHRLVWGTRVLND